MSYSSKQDYNRIKLTESVDQLWSRYGADFRRFALAGTVLVTLVFVVLALTSDEVHPVNPGLVLLLLTLLVSATFGFRAGLVAAVLSNILVAFFFLRPLYTFTVEDPEELASLAVFTLASAIGSSLLQTFRVLADRAQYGQAQAEALLNLNRSIIGQPDPQVALEQIARGVVDSFAVNDAAVLRREEGSWRAIASAGGATASAGGAAADRTPSTEASDRATAAMDDGAIQRIEATSELFVPLAHANRRLGVLRVTGPFGDTPFRNAPEQLLLAFAGEAALAINRIDLARAVRQAEALKDSDAIKTAILNSISHDLKTPLATIKAATSSLQERDIAWTEADIRAFLANIETETDRLNRTISELLDLNRLQAGAITPILKPESLLEIAESAIETASTASGDRRIFVEVPDVIVDTDAVLLRQALANLIENAAVHSRPGGAIWLDASGGGDEFHITVRDEGPGPDPRDLPYLFDPFFRSGQAGLRASGSGLGLAIVRGFVTLCSGTVDAAVTADGSTFTITLPARLCREVAVS